MIKFVSVTVFAAALATAAASHAAPAGSADTLRPSAISCRLIRTAAQLQAMKNDLTTSYCLANDIDLRSIANFQPIGDFTTPFAGNFFGNGHVIRNLRIADSADFFVGLFGYAQPGTVIRDVSLVNVNIRATASNAIVGGLIGQDDSSMLRTSRISHVSVTGKVKCSGTSCWAGGIAGVHGLGSSLVNSWSSADVVGGQLAGGAAGVSEGTIADSFATGAVICADDGCEAGGLVGEDDNAVTHSFATGAVHASNNGTAGGLIGFDIVGPSQSFASGQVSGGASSKVGGLIGFAEKISVNNVTDQCYAVGRVRGGTGATVGGLIGSVSGATATNSYWDKNTTGQAASAGGGAGLTTVQLRARLWAGFDTTAWAINRTLSYPFLNDPDLDFASPLATLVQSNKVFTFLPISQLDRSQYRFNPAHEANASLAAVYAMIARAVGITDNVAKLKNVKVDRYFWHDPRQTTTFTGPVTQHAALGALKPLAAHARLTRANVVGKLDAHRLVILRGSFIRGNGTRATHWMLATLYTKGPGNIVDTVVANDPWTGSQVLIDPVTRTVVSPANFPLKGFKVNGYQAVAVH